jgi:L-asparaginase
MKLLIIFTGGTIGSSVKDGYISVDEANIKRLVDAAIGVEGALHEKNSVGKCIEETDIRVINPYTILSETLNGTHIATLVGCINENISGYDGIIVCHGTDTLLYTAAALGFSFSDAEVPIVLVSSNYVLDDPRANGFDNIKTAVEFITGRSNVPGLMNRRSRRGVWVSYKNSGEEPGLYAPFELLPHQAYDDSLYVMEQAGVEEFRTDEMNEACLRLGEESGILWIKAYPGMSYSHYINDEKKPVCILLDTFHSGTLNTSDSELYKLAHWADRHDVPLYLTGLRPGVSYETTKVYGQLGIKPLFDMSPITAYMWLWICSKKER